MSDLELLRRLAPPVSAPDEDARERARAAISPSPGRPGRPGRRRALRLGLVGVAAAAIAAGAVVVASDRDDSGQAWAAEVVRVAEAAPRLLVDAPGWRVVRADQFAVGDGEMTFARGDAVLELRWIPRAGLGDRGAKLAEGADVDVRLPVLGREARVLGYPDDDEFRALWVDGDAYVELRGAAPDLDAFAALLDRLRRVGVDEWLTAMPVSVVRPAARAEVVAEMLRGLPLPPGLDVDALGRGDVVRDRYQLGAAVAGRVACGWLDRWAAGKRAGDDAAMREAAAAMATSRAWPILREMQAQGAYPDAVWELADAVKGDGTVVGGKELRLEDAYQSALGCGVPAP
ncbi:MAG: hypothetical protein R3C15_03055 [Thermoleophilia bacterium]